MRLRLTKKAGNTTLFLATYEDDDTAHAGWYHFKIMVPTVYADGSKRRATCYLDQSGWNELDQLVSPYSVSRRTVQILQSFASSHQRLCVFRSAAKVGPGRPQ